MTRRNLISASLAFPISLITVLFRADASVDDLKQEPRDESEGSDVIKIFLCGDVMTGRGIDQVLPHPSDPKLCEPSVVSAATYVGLAEAVHGSIAKPVAYSYIWGEALAALARERPDVMVLNLETAITTHPKCEPKGINYRMNPANVACLTEAEIDCCVLANNHVLDWGRAGLLETLATLEASNITYAGAGRDAQAAAAPAVVEVEGKGRAIVFGFGSATSGIPEDWAAGPGTPGINLLPDLSGRTVERIRHDVTYVKKPGDVVIASIHWGGNWGYDIPRDQRDFARRLIDGVGVDIVHGHSSHHAKGIEIYKNKPIIFGCGDFLNDYEGISGYEAYRDDLALMYFPSIAVSTGKLAAFEMTPLQIRRFRLHRTSAQDAEWLANVIGRESAIFGTRVVLHYDNKLVLDWH